MKQRKCAWCGFDKPTSEFGKMSLRKDGLHSWCNGCRTVKSSKMHADLKEAVVKHYSPSGRCQCCGEYEIKFLCVDHIEHGRGNPKPKVTNNLYRWLKVNGYPVGFQILCHNCNMAKGAFGQCPHKTQITENKGLK